MKFRQARSSDLSQLLEIEQYIIETERPIDSSIMQADAFYYDLAALMDDQQACVMVAEDQRKIVATGYARIRSSSMWLEHQQHSYLGFMYVAPEYRGQALNKQLVDRLIEWSREQGVHDLYLEVYAQKEAAIKAYQKAGFKPNVLEMKLSLTGD